MINSSQIMLSPLHFIRRSLLVLLLGVAPLLAEPAPWVFSPPTMGRALQSGGWMVDCPLGNVDACPEFSFSFQLIYLSNRNQEGLFGSGWFCPQLESSMRPLERGVLLWTLPGGGQVGLQQNPEKTGEYRSADRQWKARVTPSKQVVANEEGWEYQYSKGRLDAVASPGRHLLEFEWDKNQLKGVQIRDAASNTRILILAALYGENKRISSLKLNGQLHKFAYVKDGTVERLSAWVPPIGEIMKFLYHPDSGVLAKSGSGNTEDPARIETFKTAFVDPSKTDAAAAPDPSAKKNANNYWLISDRDCSYAYGRKGKEAKQWDASQITVTHKTGVTEKMSYAETRGIVTTQRDSVEQKRYYYRSPGQKYDGKLRRIEENGSVTAEYRYDRKTGLLTETIDKQGVSTFFDYDPKFRPSKRLDWEPKPLRVRRGSRAKSEVIAEYVYNEFGKLTAAKDGTGKLTQYTYTPRGEIASVTNPAGDTTSYTYDPFGRCTSVSAAGRTEKAEYDALGRLKSQIAADGAITEITYNENGHQSLIKRNGKTVKELVRDDFQRVIGEKDALSRLSRLERDVRGNLTAQIAPNGSVTRYEYDTSDRRIAQIDGNGNKINFAYDARGHLIKQTNALGNSQTWNYDPKTGKLLERANGEQTIRHSYDKNGALTGIDYGSGESLAFAYDTEKRPLSARGPDSTFESSYDDEGRLTAIRTVCGTDEHVLSYRYNRRGQRSGLMISKLVTTDLFKPQYQTLQQTEQVYDPAGRLSFILSNGIPVISYRYDSVGRPIQKTYGIGKNGRPALTVDITYDASGHLGRMLFQGGSLTSPLDLDYEWDAADQLTRRTWNGQTLRYEYDPSGQLLKVIDDKDQSILEAYTYDLAGNMLTKYLHGQLTAMTYNAGNQLVKSYQLRTMDLKSMETLPKSPEALEKLADFSLAHSYDRAGRLLGTGPKPTHTYGWLDKLISTTLPNGTQTTHTYWPDGQLATISSSSSSNPPSTIHDPRSPSESFLWDGLALLKRNDTVYIIESHPSGGIPIASHPIGKPEQITYHLNDLLGTTLATVSPAGVNFSRLTSFGQPLKASTDGSSLGTDAPSSPRNPVPNNTQLPPTKR